MKDVQLLKEKLARAVLTLKVLPPDPRNKPQGYLTSWPDMIRNGRKGAILHRGPMRFTPNNRDITELYDIIDALYALSEFQRRLLWARANLIPWKSLQSQTGKSRTHLHRLHQNALLALQNELASKKNFKKTG